MTTIALDPRSARSLAAPEQCTDEALARRAGHGDDAAYAAIYARYHARIEAYCRAIVRHDEDARDAAQTAMTKALVAIRSQRETLHLRSWLYRIAHNEALTVLRRRRHHHELTDALESHDADPVVEVLVREQLRATLAALGTLPASHREALLLRELGGLDYTSVAEVMGMTPRAARQAVFRARRVLRADRAAAEQSQCPEVRSVLAGHDGRRRRARTVRVHLRTCQACRDWDAARRPARPRALSVLPTALASAASSLWGWLGGAVAGSPGGVGAAATKLVTGAAVLAAGTAPIAQHEIVTHDAHRARPAVTTHQAASAGARESTKAPATPPALGASSPARATRATPAATSAKMRPTRPVTARDEPRRPQRTSDRSGGDRSGGDRRTPTGPARGQAQAPTPSAPRTPNAAPPAR
jgi:RNA polymerase sigma factor (sigma-70 family)